jgi:hypothetical protein
MPPREKRRKGGFRHLIYLIDGTWLWAGSDKTLDVYSNIYRLNMLLNADDENGRAQIVHYVRGLGATEGGDRLRGGAFAYGIDETIADLYVNVCSNYQNGDKIYIFGFSRGAVVARALTGLLSHGILETHHINLFAHVWADYTNQGEIIFPGQPRKTVSESNERPPDYKSFCSNKNPQIEFVGVFDTVSGGHGVADLLQKLRLKSQNVSPNVKHAVQLLAIDETRDFFEPIFWTGRTVSQRGLTFEQIWMPGVHSDVGGAYSERHLGNLALLTMIDRVIKRTSLSFDLKRCQDLEVLSKSGDVIRIHNERTRFWSFTVARPRTVDVNIVQSIHPFAVYLDGKAVGFKSAARTTPYELRSVLKPPKVARIHIRKVQKHLWRLTTGNRDINRVQTEALYLAWRRKTRMPPRRLPRLGLPKSPQTVSLCGTLTGNSLPMSIMRASQGGNRRRSYSAKTGRGGLQLILLSCGSCYSDSVRKG